MANSFVNIPVPTTNSTGAAVDVSALGKTKTLIIGGGFHATVNVDFATDAAGTDWAPLATFQGPGNLTVDVAAQWIRARTSSYQSGAPNLDVGADDAGAAFVILTADGAAVDCSALPLFKTVVVPVGFAGTIDVSEDGTTWAQAFSFQVASPISQSRDIVAQFARVTGGVDGVAVDVTLGGAGGGSSGGSAQPNLYSALHYAWPDDWLMGAQLALGNGWNGSALATPQYSLILTGGNTALTPVTGHQRIGVCTLDTGTTDTGIAGVATQASLAMDSGLVAGGIDYSQIGFEFVGGVQTLSTVDEEYACYIGLIGNAPGYGCYFFYDRANYGDFWVARTEEAGVPTTKVLDGTGGTIAAPVAPYTYPNTNIDKLTVEYQGTGGVGDRAIFKVNDVVVWTETATLPSHSLAGFVSINKSVGTTVRRLAMDYTCLSCDIRAPRRP